MTQPRLVSCPFTKSLYQLGAQIYARAETTGLSSRTVLRDVLSMPIHGPVHSCGANNPFSKQAVCDHSDSFPSEVRTRTRQKSGRPNAGNRPS